MEELAHLNEAPKVKMRSIDSIEPYWRNPRNNDRAVPAVAESIKRYGWTQPIVIDPNGVIVAGHTRYKAAKVLELKKVPVVVLDLPEAKLKEYRIADNSVGDIATWDEALLIPELRGLEIDMQPFFGDSLDLETILADAAGAGDTPSNDDVAKAASSVADQFAEGEATRFVMVTCPHCGQDFKLAEKDYQARIGKEPGDG